MLFGFFLQGAARLRCRGNHDLGAADAFVIPPDEAWALEACSPDLSLLEVWVS
jgi:hypothetical protein